MAPRARTSRKLSPLANSETFRRFVLDQLAELGDVVPRSMFGGVGLYLEGLFIGIIAGDVLYLKTDDRTRSMFVAAGSRPFKPYAHRSGTMQYYSVPVGVLESTVDLARWGKQALAAATRAAREQPSPKRPRKVRKPARQPR
jgi:DNA transformation protein and related proteins